MIWKEYEECRVNVWHDMCPVEYGLLATQHPISFLINLYIITAPTHYWGWWRRNRSGKWQCWAALRSWVCPGWHRSYEPSTPQTIFGIMTCPMYFGDVTLCSRHAMCGLHQVPQEMCLSGSFSCLLAWHMGLVMSCPLSSLSWWQSCLAYHFTTPMSPAWSYKHLHSVAQQCKLFIADDAWLCVRKSHGKNRLKGLVSKSCEVVRRLGDW